MLENTDTASPGEIDETNVIKILTQIQKLKIIWYKTLKKMKMLDSYRETLKEFGIVGENIPENNSQVDNSNSFFKNKLAKNVRPEVDDLNNSFMNLDQKLLAALKKYDSGLTDEVEHLISLLETQYDFLIPFDQLEMIGDYGKWFTGLYVNLSPRPIHNKFQIAQLLQEVQVVKNIRHPNIEMHLGITFKKDEEGGV